MCFSLKVPKTLLLMLISTEFCKYPSLLICPTSTLFEHNSSVFEREDTNKSVCAQPLGFPRGDKKVF